MQTTFVSHDELLAFWARLAGLICLLLGHFSIVTAFLAVVLQVYDVNWCATSFGIAMEEVLL